MNSFIATPAGLEREVIIYISKGLKPDLNTAVLLSLFLDYYLRCSCLYQFMLPDSDHINLYYYALLFENDVLYINIICQQQLYNISY